MGGHRLEQTPKERYDDLCSQLQEIGWGTEPSTSKLFGDFTAIVTRAPKRKDVVEVPVPDKRTSWMQPEDFKIALGEISEDEKVHIHPANKKNKLPWMEAFDEGVLVSELLEKDAEVFERVAHRLGEVANLPPTGKHFSNTEAETDAPLMTVEAIEVDSAVDSNAATHPQDPQLNESVVHV